MVPSSVAGAGTGVPLFHADIAVSTRQEPDFHRARPATTVENLISKSLLRSHYKGSPGMEPERRCKSGMDGGLAAALLVSPPLHLRMDVFLSNR